MVIRPIGPNELGTAAEVLASAFPDKLQAMLGSRASCGPAVLAALLPVHDPRAVWLAWDEQGCAGVLVLRERTSAREHVWRKLRTQLPWRASVRALAFHLVFHSVRLDPDELYVDTVAVALRCQGRGIASQLLAVAGEEARRREKRRLALYCIDRNEHARSVYEHLGFRVLRREGLGPLRHIVGFSATDRMELVLASG